MSLWEHSGRRCPHCSSTQTYEHNQTDQLRCKSCGLQKAVSRIDSPEREGDESEEFDLEDAILGDE